MYAMYVAKTKALISCAATAQLICDFVLEYSHDAGYWAYSHDAEYWAYSHDAAHMRADHQTGSQIHVAPYWLASESHIQNMVYDSITLHRVII